VATSAAPLSHSHSAATASPHTPPSRAQGFGMEAEAAAKRTRESGEDATASGISAVISGWFSEISPMWPGASCYSAPPIRSAPLHLLRIVMLSCPVDHTHSPFGARIFFFRRCLLMRIHMCLPLLVGLFWWLLNGK
jgi:hypothetical protein